MIHYYLMASLLLVALAAVKIDGWLSAIILLVAMFIASPGFKLPIKHSKWLLLLALCLLAFYLFPDIERYREAFEESLRTDALPTPAEQN